MKFWKATPRRRNILPDWCSPARARLPGLWIELPPANCQRLREEASLELSPPAADFLQALAASVFEQPHAMARVFKLVDVRPDFCLPGLVVSGGIAASGAPSVQADGSRFQHNRAG